MKLRILIFFENLSRKLNFRQHLTRVRGSLREDIRTFIILSRRIRIRMRNVSDISCRIKTHSIFKWLRYSATSRKVAGSIPNEVIGNFHSSNPFGRIMALGSTLSPRITRNIFLEVKATGA
jgi:hypothetical protein